MSELVAFLKCEVLPPRVGTIGLSLSPCTLPGRAQPSFTLEAGEMVLGLGIHGEAGVRRMPVSTAETAVRAMLDHMTHPESATRMELAPGDRVVVMVNNLGSVTNLEMGILTKEVISQVTGRMGLAVER